MSVLTKRSKLLISDYIFWEDTRPSVYSNWIFLWTYVWAPVNFHIWIQFKRINLRKTTIHISQEIKSLFSFQIICCEDDILIQYDLSCWYQTTLFHHTCALRGKNSLIILLPPTLILKVVVSWLFPTYKTYIKITFG